MGNIEWRIRFPEANFYVLAVGGSYHSPLLFVPNPKNTKLLRPFRFLDMGFKDEECEEVISLRWGKTKKNSEKAIARTLKSQRKYLIRWNKTKFGNVDRSINGTKVKIEEIRSLYPTNKTIAIELELTKKLKKLLSRKENLWRQKSREVCLKKAIKTQNSSTLVRSIKEKRIKLKKLRTNKENGFYLGRP